MSNNFGRFQLLDRLGEGSMSIVYKAFDPKTNRVIALKILRDERNQSPDYRARFLREAKAVGTLSHPNIVTVIEVGEADGRPYIGMEVIDGIPLNVEMKTRTHFDVATTLRLGMQIADALNNAHEKGIVHRDVKPSNILLLKNKTDCKITDFGIAHIEAQDMTYQTQVGEMLGTPQYMSPEQVLGKKVDGRSDLFSLGVILYQLLSGKKAFDAPSVANVLFKIATESPQPIGQVAAHLPQSVKVAVDRLLKKQPEKRFQSGTELSQHFARILANLESQGSAKTVVNQSSTVLSLVAVGIAVVASLTTLSAYQRWTDQRNLIEHHGESISKLITYQIAEPLLAKDWPNVELFAHDISEKQQFAYLSVVDHTGVVRGSSDATSIGKPLSTSDRIPPQENRFDSEKELYHFNSPIEYGGANIGEIRIGLNAQEIQRENESVPYVIYGGVTSIIIFLLMGFFTWLRSRPTSEAPTEKTMG